MIKENNQMYKIAIIDKGTELFSILDEQKDIEPLLKSKEKMFINIIVGFILKV